MQSLHHLSLILAATLLLSLHSAASQTNNKAPEKVLLFSIRAGSGFNALQEYRRNSSHARPPANATNFPDLFRSSLLNNLDQAVRAFNAGAIVAEMRRNDTPQMYVARFVRPGEAVSSETWFDNSLFFFKPWSAINGSMAVRLSSSSGGASRSFLVQPASEAAGNCDTMRGAMGVAESASDPCDWVQAGGKPPVLFYSRRFLEPFKTSAHFADQLIIYLTQGEEFQRTRQEYMAAAARFLRLKDLMVQRLEAELRGLGEEMEQPMAAGEPMADPTSED